MDDNTDLAHESLPERGDDMPFRFLDLPPGSSARISSEINVDEQYRVAQLYLRPRD